MHPKTDKHSKSKGSQNISRKNQNHFNIRNIISHSKNMLNMCFLYIYIYMSLEQQREDKSTLNKYS